MKTTKSKKNAPSKPSIQKFFKPTPKEPVKNAIPNVKSVYVHALLDKLKSFDDENASNVEKYSDRATGHVAIASTTEPLTEHVEENNSNRFDQCQASDHVEKSKRNGCSECLRMKYVEVSKSFLKLSVRYTELMMKHEELVSLSTGTARSSTEQESEGASQASSVSDDNVFTANEIKCLKCLPLGKNKDSTFILNCVQYAYKNDVASLTKKTLKGTRARYEVQDGELVTVKPGKDPLTPQKVQRIQQLFVDRVTKSKCMAGEFAERVKLTNINKLIASAVKNVTNKEAPKVLPSRNADLNL